MTDFSIKPPLPRAFYAVDALTLAEKLIGKTLVRCVHGVPLAAVITETEAYMGAVDRASHAYGGRLTERTKTLFLPGGHAYVYLIYSCMNITANAMGVPEGVLIRAVFPIAGEEVMERTYRANGRRRRTSLSEETALTPRALYSLTNGPGKLCVAMSIDRSLNANDMTQAETGGEDDNFFVQDDEYCAAEILRSPRIGIDYAGEAAGYPWRFSVKEENGIPLLRKKGEQT
ncbi:MAG: DNA-3-methyladenine glycosylase [Eubacteriales bacterium]